MTNLNKKVFLQYTIMVICESLLHHGDFFAIWQHHILQLLPPVHIFQTVVHQILCSISTPHSTICTQTFCHSKSKIEHFLLSGIPLLLRWAALSISQIWLIDMLVPFFELWCKNLQEKDIFYFSGGIFYEWTLCHWLWTFFRYAFLYQMKWAFVKK